MREVWDKSKFDPTERLKGKSTYEKVCKWTKRGTVNLYRWAWARVWSLTVSVVQIHPFSPVKIQGGKAMSVLDIDERSATCPHCGRKQMSAEKTIVSACEVDYKRCLCEECGKRVLFRYKVAA